MLGTRDAGDKRAAVTLDRRWGPPDGGHGVRQPQCGGIWSAMATLSKRLFHQLLVLGLFFLSGCDLPPGAQRDINRLVHGKPSQAASPPRLTPMHQAYRSASPANTAAKTDSKPQHSKAEPQQTASSPPAPPAASASATLMGKSEGQVRAMLGPPTSVEERAPGKTWHYRDGRCSVNVQLYPNVQTRQFGTLGYDVQSDDNSDEGKRACMARIGSRAE
jgi:hypothetical protein